MANTRFAELEQRTALVAFRHTRNCVCLLDGVAVDAIFSDDYGVGGAGSLGMGGTTPVIALAASVVPDGPDGLPVTVDGVAYRVIEQRSNGAGEAHLLLGEPA